ncbi:protein IMPACT isoform X2 [Acipenser ruthenus]|uniref:protein IMPACT isoform X2 n=1 Tax=Acipenser ruthenus TaxID=7906 RepID=UPI00274077E1|nr:protein IMPACT isoform X2 [Acipenser ruthenus]
MATTPDTGLEEENLHNQIDEIEALSSIYGDEWCVIDEASRIFCIKISDDLDQPKWTLCLQVILPSEYPTSAPPIYQLNRLRMPRGCRPYKSSKGENPVELCGTTLTAKRSAPWLRGPERMELSNRLEESYAQNIGESILYLWVETIREFLVEKSHSADSESPVLKKTTEEVAEDLEDYFSPGFQLPKCQDQIQALALLASEGLEDEELPPIKHGEPITDRRSTFQPHLAPVVTPKQVKMVLDKLYENKKIASATHNIHAYRIYCEDKQTFLQDCEDDGETAAGGRLLHLLQILDVRNVLVVVSRWYGGILLGPDRFKHINNCARNILVEENYIESTDDPAKSGGKNKKQKSKKGK